MSTPITRATADSARRVNHPVPQPTSSALSVDRNCSASLTIAQSRSPIQRPRGV